MTVFSSGARKWMIYTVLMVALSSITIGIIAIEYSNYAVRKNSQQWCTVVITLDDAYKANPPTTPTGQHLADEFHKLRKEFKCKG